VHSNWMTALLTRCGCFPRTPGYVRKRRHHSSGIMHQHPASWPTRTRRRPTLPGHLPRPPKATPRPCGRCRSCAPPARRRRAQHAAWVRTRATSRGYGLGRRRIRHACGRGGCRLTCRRRRRHWRSVRAGCCETLDPLAGQSPFTMRISCDIVASRSIQVARGMQLPMNMHG
jgi:hypothetical protein